MIIETLCSKKVINYIEGYLWSDIVVLCLERLNFIDVIGDVGRLLLENRSKFPKTLSKLGEYIKGQRSPYNIISSSSLITSDNKSVIDEWICSEEQGIMLELYSDKKNEYLIVVSEAFIRDIQIAPNKYILDMSMNKGVDTLDYNWDDFSGDVTAGIYKSNNLENAIEQATIDLRIDKYALKGYKLS